jgi:hypothetical protein
MLITEGFRRMIKESDYEAAKRRALARKPLSKPTAAIYRVTRYMTANVFVDTNTLIYAVVPAF